MTRRTDWLIWDTVTAFFSTGLERRLTYDVVIFLFQLSSTFGIDGVPELEVGEELVRSRNQSPNRRGLPLAKLALKARALGDLEA
jgi:hypothetical protein